MNTIYELSFEFYCNNSDVLKYGKSGQSKFYYWYKFNGKYWQSINILQNNEIKNVVNDYVTSKQIKTNTEKFKILKLFIEELKKFYYTKDLQFNKNHRVYFSNGVFDIIKNTFDYHNSAELNNYTLDIDYVKQNDANINKHIKIKNIAELATCVKNWASNIKPIQSVIFITHNSNSLINAFKILFNIKENNIVENGLCLISDINIFNIYPYIFYPIFIVNNADEYHNTNHKLHSVLIDYSDDISAIELLNVIVFYSQH